MSTPRSKILPLQIASIVVGAIAIVSIALSKFISGPLILFVVAAAMVKLYAGESHKLSEHNEASWLDVRSFLSTLQPTQ